MRQPAQASEQAAIDMLVAITLLGDSRTRDSLRDDVLKFLTDDQPITVKQQAVRALATIASQAADKFTRLVKLMDVADLRDEAVRALLTVPATERDPKLAAQLSEALINLAEATPIEARTSDRFVDGAQLAESLFVSLPDTQAKSLQARWRAISVRVVRIKTVEEEMRYDLKYFAVEAASQSRLSCRTAISCHTIW